MVGVIHYYLPPPRRLYSDIDGIGHYTALLLRRNKVWIDYDDQKSDKKPKIFFRNSSQNLAL